MIVFPKLKLIFIHIPRTSGIALSTALLEAFPNARIHKPEHATTKEALEEFPDFKTFTIVRNPWKCTESIWRWRVHVAQFPQQYTHLTQDTIKLCQQTYDMTFDEFINDLFQYIPQGFYKNWCTSQTTCFRYEDNPYNNISKLVGRKLNVRKMNMSIVPLPTWTPFTLEKIAQHCKDDLRIFRYVSP